MFASAENVQQSGLGAIQKYTNLTLHTSILVVAVDESHTVETLPGKYYIVGKLAIQYYLFDYRYPVILPPSRFAPILKLFCPHLKVISPPTQSRFTATSKLFCGLST